MPHISVDYSAQLAGRFDRTAFASELHRLVAERSGSAGVCKTVCRATDETFAGDPVGPFLFVHVEIGLLPGRSADVRARLSEDALDLVGKHLDSHPGDASVVRSVEVRELAATYRLSPGGPAVTPRCPNRDAGPSGSPPPA